MIKSREVKKQIKKCAYANGYRNQLREFSKTKAGRF
jgi:hypothetical protein